MVGAESAFFGSAPHAQTESAVGSPKYCTLGSARPRQPVSTPSSRVSKPRLLGGQGEGEIEGAFPGGQHGARRVEDGAIAFLGCKKHGRREARGCAAGSVRLERPQAVATRSLPGVVAMDFGPRSSPSRPSPARYHRARDALSISKRPDAPASQRFPEGSIFISGMREVARVVCRGTRAGPLDQRQTPWGLPPARRTSPALPSQRAAVRGPAPKSVRFAIRGARPWPGRPGPLRWQGVAATGWREGLGAGELEHTILEAVERHTKAPRPCFWTAKATDILAKVIRARASLNAPGISRDLP